LKFFQTALLLLAVFLVACQAPPVPPEVRKAETQDKDLWRAGAAVFFSQEYADYARALREARQRLESESLRLGYFRDYKRVREDFAAVLKSGDELLARVGDYKNHRSSSLREAADDIRSRMATLRDVTLSLSERGNARKQLAKAEIYMREADSLRAESRFDEASARISSAEGCVKDAESTVFAMISRYLDRRQVDIWRKWTEETIAESRTKGVVALVVSKLEKRLAVYKNGRLVRSYEIGLGFNGLSNKVHSGDNATPEGRYRIIKKIGSSQYYKALMINYPNEEDVKRFALDKKKGLIPGSVGIGGDIEIHGGGPNSLTRGCISMDNADMDDLYDMVSIGTPIAIVGTNETENYVIRAIRKK
jgi:L,D-peptidoglycan transpeptidase YkuD (ErfK/YbiS/YcfS/YnhG family)